MSGPFRTRGFRPVPAELRPHRRRAAARALVVTAGCVLLLRDTDPGLPGSRWWVTPGGGIDPGEDAVRAVIRELFEETGLVASPAGLLGPVAVRDVTHGYSDQVLHQREDFFVLRLPERIDPDPGGLTAEEQVTLDGWAWQPLDGLAEVAEPVWPANLADLVALADLPDAWPLDLGHVEESTVPVDPALH
jgi:8-oxo-dGTP pyrophosphatase MutT (NUDIX family)